MEDKSPVIICDELGQPQVRYDEKPKDESKKRMTPDEFIAYIIRLCATSDIKTITINKNDKGNIVYVGSTRFKNHRSKKGG
jgi:hypothetical protein